MFSPFGSGEMALGNSAAGEGDNAGEISPLQPEDHGVTGELADHGWRASLLAIAASRSALGEEFAAYESLRQNTGVIIGTSLFNIGLFHDYLNNFGSTGPTAIPPWALHYSLPLAHASHVAVTFGLQRMCETLTDPLTAGICALGMGYRTILEGEEISLLAGGVESPSGGFLLDFLAELLTGNAHQRPAEGCAIFHIQAAADSGQTRSYNGDREALAYLRGYRMAFTGGDEYKKNAFLASFAAESYCDDAGADLVIDAAELPDPLPRTLTAGPVLACGLAIALLNNYKPDFRAQKKPDLPFIRQGSEVDRVIVTADGAKGECVALAFQSKRDRDRAVKNSFPLYMPKSKKDDSAKAAITGLGVSSAIGVGQKDFFANLISGKSGVVSFVPPGLEKAGPSTAAPVQGLAPLPTLQRSTQLVSAAAEEALMDAGVKEVLPAFDQHKGHEETISQLPGENRVGLYLAETLSSAEAWVAIGEDLRDGRLELGSKAFSQALKNLKITNVQALMARFGLEGEAVTFASGCSGGLFALGRAARDCLHAAGPTLLAGGVDSDLFPFAFGILSQAKLLTVCADPGQAGRPFDRARDGEVTGEGSAMFVLEPLENAIKRSIKPYALFSGFGAAGDGHHFKYNKPDGEALYEAMKEAIERARLKPAAIDLVVAHASGFQGSDAIETRALVKLFNNVSPLPPVISLKGATGQPFSAGAPLQVAAALCALRENIIPPTAHFRQGDEDDPFDHVPVARKPGSPLRHILITSYGYGGGKAAMVLSAYGAK